MQKNIQRFARVICATSVSLIAVTLPQVGRAQMVQEAKLTQSDFQAAVVPNNAAGDAERNASAGASGGEIVVTAQKRAERLHDVPISITALTGTTLSNAGIYDTAGLTAVTPGLTFVPEAANAQPAIRGISSTGSTAGDAANVATYIDGVYMPFQEGNVFRLNDISQIEVLKGPQGTLFGRNATGGAISIHTRDPSFSPSGEAGFSYGRFDEGNAYGYISGPISDNLAANLFAQGHQDYYYPRDVVTGKSSAYSHDQSVRAKLLFKPSENLSFLLAGDLSSGTDHASTATEPQNKNVDVRAVIPTVPLPTGPNETALNFTPFLDSQARGLSLKTVYATNLANFTSISAIRFGRTYQHDDLDSTPIPEQTLYLTETDNFVSEELNAVSAYKARLQWSIGAYFMSDIQKLSPLEVISSYPPTYTSPSSISIFSRDKTRSLAGFGEITFALSENLKLNGGLRYSSDDIGFQSSLPNYGLSGGGQTTSGSLTERATIQYIFNRNHNVYISFNRGFKAGVFNSESFSIDTTPVKPEYVNAYEAGYKGTISSTFSVEISGFHYDYKDIQVQAFNQSNATSILQNAASAKITGAEANVHIRPIDGLEVNGSVEYLHARYSAFPGAQVYMAIPAGGNQVGYENVAGNHMIRAPDLTLSLSGNYSFGLLNGVANIAGNGFYSSKLYFDVANVVEQRPYVVVNANASWLAPSKHFRVGVYAENVTNTRQLQTVLQSAELTSVTYAKPWTVGGRFTVYFQ